MRKASARNFLKFGFYFLLLNLSACSWTESLVLKRSEHRVFQVDRQWLRSGLTENNHGFRKINRMQALTYKNSKGVEHVIAATSLEGLVSIEKETGHVVWRSKIPEGVEASGLIFKGRIYVGALDGTFYALDAENGGIVWKFVTRSEHLSEPILENGILYFMNAANTLYAVDAADGKQLWTYTRQDTSYFSVRGGSRPVIRDDVVFAAFSEGSIVALLKSNGALKWEKTLNRNKRFRDLDSNLLIDRDVLYVMGFDDRLYALQPGTGDLIWKYDKGGYGAPVIEQDRLFYASTSSEMICLERSSGKLLWAHKISRGLGTTPVASRGVLVYGESQGPLQFLDLNSGKSLGSFDPGRGVMTPPALDESKSLAFFTSGEGNVYAIKFGWKNPDDFANIQR